MPKRVAVYGGEGDNLKKLNDVGIDECVDGGGKCSVALLRT